MCDASLTLGYLFLLKSNMSAMTSTVSLNRYTLPPTPPEFSMIPNLPARNFHLPANCSPNFTLSLVSVISSKVGEVPAALTYLWVVFEKPLGSTTSSS